MKNEQQQNKLVAAINEMTEKCGGWERHREASIKYITNKCNEYSQKLDLSPLQVFQALEKKRDYSYPNYYQEANQPNLDGDRVFLFETQSKLLETVQPEQGFICPSCSGVSKSPYNCDCVKEDGKQCGWKSYGLFGTGGDGIKVAIKEGFLEKPVIEEIFLPVAMKHLV
ncbi:hypothetical protein [Photobacterium leiognathi]|uniref:hypothetical protein n=1 Tax=Photobacterium leiognathi TaxID=553611 RepID=UPI002739BDC0|nr:hypothetical protein [Photobacterium leiognathi]